MINKGSYGVKINAELQTQRLSFEQKVNVEVQLRHPSQIRSSR